MLSFILISQGEGSPYRQMREADLRNTYLNILRQKNEPITERAAHDHVKNYAVKFKWADRIGDGPNYYDIRLNDNGFMQIHSYLQSMDEFLTFINDCLEGVPKTSEMEDDNDE